MNGIRGGHTKWNKSWKEKQILEDPTQVWDREAKQENRKRKMAGIKALYFNLSTREYGENVCEFWRRLLFFGGKNGVVA